MRFPPASLLFCLIFASGFSLAADLPVLTPEAKTWLGERIFLNECNGRDSCLTSWNAGEEFPSLGIGHFIWYRQGQQAPFEESFPALLGYLRELGTPLPRLLEESGNDAPWPDRNTFLAAQDTAAMQELRKFLASHKAEQAEFIVQRFQGTLDRLVTSAPPQQRSQLQARIEHLAAVNPPQGLYALIDYTHFKGSGLSETERYRDQGWGLVQVLQEMEDTGDPLPAFVASASRILENRVVNAPPERNESRWLQGWLNRLDTYLVAPSIP